MNYTFKFDGGELDCELDYEPECRGSREFSTGLQIEPDEPENAFLVTAKISGVDIAELLSVEIIGLIEAKALKQ